MEWFHVVESGEGIERAVRRALAAHGGLTERNVSRNCPALLVVSPRAAALGMELPPVCRTVLLPGDAGQMLRGVRAVSAVSYGPSPRDSLTISSREQRKLWIALQRELVTVGGQVVERQEFSVELGAGERELSALAAAGAMLLLGVTPEWLGEMPLKL